MSKICFSAGGLEVCLPNGDVWAPRVEREAAQHMARCEEILFCREKIRFYQQRLDDLQAQQDRYVLLRALQTNAEDAWNCLSPEKRLEVLQCREYLLAALRSPEALPPELTGAQWSRNVEPELVNDRELLLARLKRPCFRHFYRTHHGCYAKDRGRFQIPVQYYGDKSIMLAVIAAYPEIILHEDEEDDDASLLDTFLRQSRWTAELRNDPDILRAFLKTSDGRICLCRSMNVFSERLRSQPDLMLDVIRQVGPAGLRHCPVHLRNNREFCLQVAGVQPSEVDFFSVAGPAWTAGALKYFSKRLRADCEVAAAFCRVQGRNLAHCSYPLRRNERVIRLAAQSDPAAIVYALKGPARDALTSDKEFMVDLLQRAFASGRCSFGGEDGEPLPQKVYKWCSKSLQEDADVISAALLTGCLRPRDIRGELGRSVSFWRNLLAKRPDLWRWGLHQEANGASRLFTHQERLELAMCAIQNIRPNDEDEGLTEEILGEFPSLRSDPRAVLAVLEHQEYGLEEWTTDALSAAPDAIRSDRLVLLQYCSWQGSQALCYLAENAPLLLEDRELVQAALENCPYALEHVPPRVQELFPELVADAIGEAYFYGDLWEVQDYVHEALWSNRDIAKAWIRAGGGFLHDCFPEEFADDAELLLLVAQHGNGEALDASVELCSNVDFMRDLVEIDGRYLQEACGGLERNFDLALIAFAGTKGLVGEYQTVEEEDDDDDEGGFEFLTDFARHVRAQLRTHEAFQEILKGWSPRSPRSHQSKESSTDNNRNKCALAILNQGEETTVSYKRHIAEYLGVPMGKELLRFRQASVNLSEWGF